MSNIAQVVDVERFVPAHYETVQEVQVDFRDRIERGAELLDDRFGTDWRNAVNTSQLNLASGSFCVLGQVFVEEIVNGAVRTVNGHQSYHGGIDFLFPRAAFYGRSYEERDAVVAAHGFVVSNKDEDAVAEIAADAGLDRLTLTELYEILTAQWVEWLDNRRQDD